MYAYHLAVLGTLSGSPGRECSELRFKKQIAFAHWMIAHELKGKLL